MPKDIRTFGAANSIAPVSDGIVCPECSHSRRKGPEQIEQIHHPDRWRCHKCGAQFCWTSGRWEIELLGRLEITRAWQRNRGYQSTDLDQSTSRRIPCFECNGTGQVLLLVTAERCGRCSGTGIIISASGADAGLNGKEVAGNNADKKAPVAR